MFRLTTYNNKLNMMYVVPADNNNIIRLTLLYPESKN